MITTNRLTVNDVRPTIDESKVKLLGRHGDLDYMTHRGQEFAVSITPTDPQAYSRAPGEAMIARRVSSVIEGTRQERTELFRALPVASGTFERLSVRAREQAARLAHKDVPRPLDALAAHPLLHRKAAEVMRFREEADPLVADLSSVTRGIVLPAREQRRGAEAIVAVLRSKGVELTLSADKAAIVPMTARGAALDSVRELIEQAAPLLVPYLAGTPRLCQLGHKGTPPEALSLLVGGAAACEQHLAGETP